MRKKLFLGAVIGILSMVCTSCQFMPVEEEFPSAPVVRSYEQKEYKQTVVMRGDLISDTTVRCTYVSVKQEDLSFSLGGVYIDKAYVTEGQQVQAGDLLAELEMGSLAEQIDDQEYVLKKLNLQKKHILEMRQLENTRQDILLEGVEEETALAQRQAALQSYDRQLQEVEDSIYIAEMYREELEESRRERQIYAGIDGIVTYVQSITEGSRSAKGKKFITIADPEVILFTVTGEDTAYFVPGDEVTIQVGEKEYAAYAAAGTELGLPEQKENGEAIIYLQLLAPDSMLESGTKGTIDIVLEQREDVLYVSKKAIKRAEGRSFVYMLDEKGLRIMRDVTTGLEIGDYVEITAGLNEGDVVITE